MNIFELADNMPQRGSAVVLVMGLGGVGCQAIAAMAQTMPDLHFVAMDTDQESLMPCKDIARIELLERSESDRLSERVGRARSTVFRFLHRSPTALHPKGIPDMVFLVGGLGGGLCSGGLPALAEWFHGQGMVTVALVAMPGADAEPEQHAVAERALRELRELAGGVIQLPLARMSAAGKVTGPSDVSTAIEVLHWAVRSVSELILRPGVIGIDFADVRTVLEQGAGGTMAIGSARGPERAARAVSALLKSPLLADHRLMDAKGILVCISADDDLCLDDFSVVGERVAQYVSVDATVVIGTSLEPSLGDIMRLTMIATGLPTEARRAKVVRPTSPPAKHERREKQRANRITHAPKRALRDLGPIKILVVGLGGIGVKTVARMARLCPPPIQYLALDSDAAELEGSIHIPHALVPEPAISVGGIMDRVDKGLVGMMDFLENASEVLLANGMPDLVFLVGGLGGGFGTGALGVLAKWLDQHGLFTVAIVTEPMTGVPKPSRFAFRYGQSELLFNTESVIVIPLDPVLAVNQLRADESIDPACEFIEEAVRSMSSLILESSCVGVDYADVRTALAERGIGAMGVGTAAGPDRAVRAAQGAVANALLKEYALWAAKGVVVCITTNDCLCTDEFSAVGEVVAEVVPKEAYVVIGVSLYPAIGSMLRVTLIAAGDAS